MVAIAGVVYLGRERMAEQVARWWLSEHGVASRLQVRSVSLTGLSATFRLGDPADPDLVVDRLEVNYALSGPWNGKPFGLATRSLRLVRPRLKVGLVNGRLSFGALQPLAQAAAKQPAANGPQPDVTVEDGTVRLLTRDGSAQLEGDATLRAGALAALNGRLAPFRLNLPQTRLESSGGAVNLTRSDGGLLVDVLLGDSTLQSRGYRLSAAQVSLLSMFPYPRPGRPARGPAKLSVVVTNGAATAGDDRLAGGALDIDVVGALDATAARQVFSGSLRASGQLTSIIWRRTNARKAAAHLAFTRLTLAHTADGLSLASDGTADLATSSVDTAGVQISSATGSMRLSDLTLRTGPDLAVTSASLNGSAGGAGAFTQAAAERLARSIPVFSDKPAYASAIARGLRGFRLEAPAWRAELAGRDGRIGVAAPVEVDAATGARLILADRGAQASLSPRGLRVAANLSVDGGGLPSLKVRVAKASLSPSGFQADLDAQGAMDALFATGAQVHAKGRLSGTGPRFQFDLAGCTPVTAARLDFDPNTVADFAGTLCPGAGPLFVAGPAGWTSQGRMEDAKGQIASFAAGFEQGKGAFQAAGRASLLTAATLTLDGAKIADTTEPIRFRPLSLQGRMTLAGGTWTGGFSAATAAGHPIGSVSIRHDTATNTGRADIDAGALAFRPGGLQPVELTPLASFARDAQGPAAFTGWFSWAPRGQLASGGDLRAKSLTFKSPLGPVLDIDADLHFTSLSPLVTAPGQRVTVAQVQAITPLSGLALGFELGADQIRIESANGQVAEGRIRLEPMVAHFTPGEVFKGVLVVDHVNVGDVIAASSLADSVKMDAVVDGRIPFALGPSGLTIQQGSLAAVRPGRLSISRKALAGAAPAGSGPAGQAGFAQDLAYQAMENLAFDQLDASLNSQPGDRLGILFHIKGRHDPPQRQKATISLGDVLHGQALAKPIALPSDTRIDLTLDTSLNFGELVRALEQAWRESTQSVADQGGSAPVQGTDATLTHK